MKEFPILYSNDLVLRNLSLDDYDEFLDYLTDELISKQFNFSHNDETVKKRLEEIVNSYNDDQKPYLWAIALKDSNELVGIIDCDMISDVDKKVSLAYGIRSKYRGNNYAYLAAKMLINYCFKKLDIHRIEIAHNIGNIASQKTIEKLGFIYEGIARESRLYDGKFVDRKTYSLLKKEWEDN